MGFPMKFTAFVYKVQRLRNMTLNMRVIQTPFSHSVNGDQGETMGDTELSS